MHTALVAAMLFAVSASAQPGGSSPIEPDLKAAAEKITGAQRISTAEASFPRVFRSVLDGRARIVSAQIASELWIGFDAARGGIYKAWSGGVRFVGAVYTTVHGPQPLSKGEAFTTGPTGSVWRLTTGGKTVEAEVRYLGYTTRPGELTFQYELRAAGLAAPISVTERPRFVDDAGRIGLDRVLELKGVPSGTSVQTAISTDFLKSPAQSFSSDGPADATPTDSQPPAPVRWVTLNPTKPTTLASRFQPPGTNALKAAYFTSAAGFRHDVLPFSRERIEDLAEDNNWLRVTTSDDVSELTPEKLKDLDAVIFFTTGALPAPVREAVIAFVEGGGGFIGVHSATDTWNESSDWAKFIGGTFDSHPWNDRVPLIITAVDHPIMKPYADSVQNVPGQPRRFFYTDEIYQFKNLAPDINVLLSLDPKADKAEPGRPYPLAWTREQGKGRIFYIALGHRDTVWKDQRFTDTLVAGLRWVTRRDAK